MKVNGVFFDLYGTLLACDDTASAWSDWLSALYGHLRECGLEMPKERFAVQCDGFFGRPEPPVKHDALTVYERRIKTLCGELGLNLERSPLQQAAAVSANAWHKHLFLDRDALSVLDRLKRHKVLGLISNFDHPPRVHALLSELELLPFFDTVVISGDVGVKKPSPEIFFLALRGTGLRPHEVVYVGDTAADVHGTRAAGMTPILLVRNESADSADFQLAPQGGDGAPSEPELEGVTTITVLTELIEICPDERHAVRKKTSETPGAVWQW